MIRSVSRSAWLTRSSEAAFSSTTSSRVRHDIAVRAPSRAASPATDNGSSRSTETSAAEGPPVAMPNGVSGPAQQLFATAAEFEGQQGDQRVVGRECG